MVQASATGPHRRRCQCDSCKKQRKLVPFSSSARSGAVSIIPAIRARQRSPDQLVRDASHLGRMTMQLTVQETPTQAIERVKAKIHIRSRYENFIGGKWVAPVKRPVFRRISRPITGQAVCEIARSTAEDIELALDAAHKAKTAWGKTSPAERAAHPEQDRRPHGGEPRDAGARRNHRQRQADPRDDGRRHPARRRPLPLLRRLPARPGRLDLARSTTTPSPTTSMSRSASSARSSRGTSRS